MEECNTCHPFKVCRCKKTSSKLYQQLQLEESMTLASLVQHNYTAGAVVKVLKRSTSNVTRELNRNGQGAGYSSQAAIACNRLRRIQGRALNSLHKDSVLFGVIHFFRAAVGRPNKLR